MVHWDGEQMMTLHVHIILYIRDIFLIRRDNAKMQGDGIWICASGCKKLRWEVSWPSHLQCIKKISLEYYPNDEKSSY
jgi:hypothetical protein